MSEKGTLECGCVVEVKYSGDGLQGLRTISRCPGCDPNVETPTPTENLADEKWKPPELPDDVSFHCPKCGLSFVSTSEVMRHKQSCYGVPPTPEDKPKVAGNYRGPDIGKWFGLRKPSEDEAAALDALRGAYTSLANGIVDTCPSNPDRTVAIRQLKESMQTAISSIVCADAWQG